MAVCSQIHTKHINTVCGQNVELLNVKLALHIMTTGLYMVTSKRYVQITFVPCVQSPGRGIGVMDGWAQLVAFRQ